MNIQLSDHFTYGRLIRFSLPSIAMMLFTSLYCVVDGICVSAFVGETEFASINLIMPYLSSFNCIAYMIGTGGAALISRIMGEGNRKYANQVFSMLIYTAFALGLILAIFGELALRKVAVLSGATGYLLETSVSYGRIVLAAIPIYMLQYSCQSFLVCAQKPNLGLIFTIAAGITNMVLDVVFIGGFRWGVIGAATATVIGMFVGGIGPTLYFAVKRKGILVIGKPFFELKAFLKTCSNGLSDCLSNMSFALMNMVFNYQLMKFAGEYGVAAYGIIMYVEFIFTSVYFGYPIGTGPIISYHYGAQNNEELHNLYRKSLILIGTISVILTLLSQIFTPSLVSLFAGSNIEYFNLAKRAMRIYSVVNLFCGITLFTIAMFAALNDGLTATKLSLLRTFGFQLVFIFVLPLFLGLDGIWLSAVCSDFCVFFICLIVLSKKRSIYGY